MLGFDPWDFVLILGSTIADWLIYDFILKEVSAVRVETKTKTTFLIGAITYIVFCNLAVVNINFKLFSGIIISIFYYFYIYDINQKKGVIIPLIFWMLFLASDLIGSSIISFAYKLNSMDCLLNNNSIKLQLIVLTKVLLFLTIPIMKCIKLVRELTYKEILCVMTPIMCNILSMLLIGTYAFNNSKNTMGEYFSVFSLSILLLGSNISLIFIIFNFIKSTKVKTENKMIKENLELQLNHYVQYKEVENKIRKMYHDINNHISCLDSLYGENEEASKYIDGIKNEIKDYSTHFKTQNPILDAILYEKNIVCQKEKIAFNVDVDFSKCNFIESIDVCTIFSNILDNSIEACLKMNKQSKRYIYIKGTVVKGFYIIKCENSKVNRIEIEEDEIITSKEDNFKHGIGLTNILGAINKYEGEMTTDYTKTVFKLVVLIPLN